MKITKSVFKNIIKECLIEILAEGMGNNIQTMIESVSVNKQSTQPITSKKLTNPLVTENTVQQNPILKEVANGVNIPNFESILADTLATTYVKQTSADKPCLANLASLQESASVNSEPEDVTNVNNSWTDIAFGTKRTTKQ